MESDTHKALKDAARHWLFLHGWRALAYEVACPIHRFKADVAGYLEPLARGLRRIHRLVDGQHENPQLLASMQRREHAMTAIVECKASRSDLLRDSADTQELVARRGDLTRTRLELEERILKPRAMDERAEGLTIGVESPGVRRLGRSLFADLDEWDFSSVRDGSYRRVLRDLARVDAALYSQTKFALAGRYRLADRLYIAALRGCIKPAELPEGWGLLEFDPASIALPANGWRVTRVIESKGRDCRDDWRIRLLRNIAVAAARDARWSSCTRPKAQTLPELSGSV